MRRRNTRGARMLAPLAAAFAIGILAGWLLKTLGPPQPRDFTQLDARGDESVREPSPLDKESPATPAAASAMRASPPAGAAAPPAALEARPLPIVPSAADNGNAIEILRRRHLR